MTLPFLFIFLGLGLIIGSFLNVVIARMNTGKTLGGRSACMSCQTKLHWYELVPVLSFVTLRGRCRTCKTRISFIYPLVEAVTALLFVALFLKFKDFLLIDPVSFAIPYVFYVIVFSILIVITAYDLRHKIIPDMLSFTFGLLSFFGIFIFIGGNFLTVPLCTFHVPTLWQFLSGPLIALPFFLCWFLSKGEWMGFGDVKLAIGIGYLLGLAGGLSAIALAFWSGAIVGIILMLLQKGYNMKSEIPFAMYLALGTFIAFVFHLNIFMISVN